MHGSKWVAEAVAQAQPGAARRAVGRHTPMGCCALQGLAVVGVSGWGLAESIDVTN